MPPAARARFFASQAELRAWLEKNHDKARELNIGFYKVGSGRTGITYKQALDEALCFGWIDGIRHAIDEKRYENRFTPRKPTSNWSTINIKRVAELVAMGLMTPAGLSAFEGHEKRRSLSYEERPRELEPAFARKLAANARAAKFFTEQPPWYQRVTIFWVSDAKKEETRARRLATLIDRCAKGVWIEGLERPGRR